MPRTEIRNAPNLVKYMLDRRERNEDAGTIKINNTCTIEANFYKKTPLFVT